MSNLRNRFVSVLCCILLSFIPCFSLAQGSSTKIEDLKLVTTLDKNQKAPFSGILLSDATAAKLFADIKFSKKECDALVDEKVDLLKIGHKSEKDILELSREISEKRLKGLISVRDDRIKFLERNYMPPVWYESGEFWFSLGIILGISTTVAAGYAIGQAR